MGVMGLALRSPTVAVLTEVDCVVVSYNSAADLPTCIDSLSSQEGIAVRVVVVDNLSSDDSVGTARQRGSAVIVNDSNRSFAAAVNQGLQQGSAPWVLILNPDAQLASGALRALLKKAQEDATVGCVVPRTLDDDGTEYPSRRSFPSIVTAAVHGFLGSVWPANPATRRYHADDTPRDRSFVVDWVSGSCMLLPQRAWESVGGSMNGISCMSRTWTCAFGCGAPGGTPCTSRPRRSRTLVGSRRGIVRSGRSCTTTLGRPASTGGQPAGGTGRSRGPLLSLL
jgi:hypothetical protein